MSTKTPTVKQKDKPAVEPVKDEVALEEVFNSSAIPDGEEETKEETKKRAGRPAGSKNKSIKTRVKKQKNQAVAEAINLLSKITTDSTATPEERATKFLSNSLKVLEVVTKWSPSLLGEGQSKADKEATSKLVLDKIKSMKELV